MSTITKLQVGAFGQLAQIYTEKGFSVLPTEAGDKRPAKEIKGWPGYSSGPLTPAKLRELLIAYPDRGIGVLTGTEIGNGHRLVAIDIDLDRFVGVAKIILENAVCAKFGKKGLTIFGRGEDGIKSTKFIDFRNNGAGDFLAGGKYCVLPSSIHPETGKPYQWIGQSLLDIDCAHLPVIDNKILSLLKFITGSEHAFTLTTGDATHDAGVALVGQLVARGCDDEQVAAIIEALLPSGYEGNSIDELREWIDSARRKGFGETGKAKSQKAAGAAELLVDSLMNSGVELFHDAKHTGYMSVPTESGGYLTYALNSTAASSVLRQRFFELTSRALTESACSSAANLLEAIAVYKSAEQNVFQRVGRSHDGIVIDRGTADGDAIVITADGYRLCNRSPVPFARSPGSLNLPVPQDGGDLRDLQELLGLSDDMFLLVVAFILNAVRPSGPYLCLLVEGEQGSGKSVLCTVLRRLIDPNEAEKFRLPDHDRDLMVLANSLFLLVFDNSSGMSANISDVLCTLATGGGYASRKLYTDGELHFSTSTRAFIINGISDVATKSDLIERLIPVELDRMDDDDRRTEAEILDKLEIMMPGLLGVIYSAIACALKNEAITELPRGIRMADAARWIQAAEPALEVPPGRFVNVLERCQVDRIVERTKNDPVVSALLAQLEYGPWESTIGELLEKIKPKAQPRYYPDTPLKLSKHLDRLRTGMKLVGVEFEKSRRSNKGVQIRVWRHGQENEKAIGPVPENSPPI